MKIRDFRTLFVARLGQVVGLDEAQSIFNIALKNRTGMDRAQLALSPDKSFSTAQRADWEQILDRLCAEEPVQYVLGEAFFFGRRFAVNPHVLIPRPETEELVAWIASEAKPDSAILDIGTGSGCIAVSLALELPGSEVSALDVSMEALKVARQNASALGARIQFIHDDIRGYASEEKYDVVVSNPPYVRHLEKAQIRDNVLKYEPHLALFVEDDDALLFYRLIAQFATRSLRPGGLLFFEINQYLAHETESLLREIGFVQIEVRKDIYGNDRMVRAIMPYS